MRKQFRDTITDLAAADDRVVMILGDVSVYLMNDFQQKYPDRFYNLGICENSIISVAAGLRSQGFIPFAHTIAPFITERSYEQIKIDMCYNRFGGNIVSCGASFDYAWDGATHHTYTDLAILRLLPECDVLQPGSRKELDVLMRSRYASGKTTYYRLSYHPHSIDMPVEFGKGVVLKDCGSGVTIMTAGPLIGNVLEACKDMPVNVVYFHTIKPIDHELIAKYANTTILIVHDAFGLQEAIHEVPGLRSSYHGLPDAFCGWYGRLEDIRTKLGLDIHGIRIRVQSELSSWKG